MPPSFDMRIVLYTNVKWNRANPSQSNCSRPTGPIRMRLCIPPLFCMASSTVVHSDSFMYTVSLYCTQTRSTASICMNICTLMQFRTGSSKKAITFDRGSLAQLPYRLEEDWSASSEYTVDLYENLGLYAYLYGESGTHTFGIEGILYELYYSIYTIVSLCTLAWSPYGPDLYQTLDSHVILYKLLHGTTFWPDSVHCTTVLGTLFLWMQNNCDCSENLGSYVTLYGESGTHLICIQGNLYMLYYSIYTIIRSRTVPCHQYETILNQTSDSHMISYGLSHCTIVWLVSVHCTTKIGTQCSWTQYVPDLPENLGLDVLLYEEISSTVYQKSTVKRNQRWRVSWRNHSVCLFTHAAKQNWLKWGFVLRYILYIPHNTWTYI